MRAAYAAVAAERFQCDGCGLEFYGFEAEPRPGYRFCGHCAKGYDAQMGGSGKGCCNVVVNEREGSVMILCRGGHE